MEHMEIRDDLAQQYSAMGDEELLRLALDPEQLTPVAKAALRDELARRRINSAERLETFRGEEEERKQELHKQTGILFLLHPTASVANDLARPDVPRIRRPKPSGSKQPYSSCFSGFH